MSRGGGACRIITGTRSRVVSLISADADDAPLGSPGATAAIVPPLKSREMA
ncbi:MAG: hypothetical protein ACYC9K_11305 [Sulfuricaulis sp.]